MGKWSARFLLVFSWTGIILAFVLVVATATQMIPSSMREREFQKERIVFLEKQLAETERAIEIKRKFLNKLNTNRAFLERVAREKLNYVKPGETVIHVEKPIESSP